MQGTSHEKIVQDIEGTYTSARGAYTGSIREILKGGVESRDEAEQLALFGGSKRGFTARMRELSSIRQTRPMKPALCVCVCGAGRVHVVARQACPHRKKPCMDLYWVGPQNLFDPPPTHRIDFL